MNEAKYIIFENVDDHTYSVIFPTWVNHSDVKMRQSHPIRAGFFDWDWSNRRAQCFGESISLGLKSDPNLDDEELNFHQFSGLENNLAIYEGMYASPASLIYPINCDGIIFNATKKAVTGLVEFDRSEGRLLSKDTTIDPDFFFDVNGLLKNSFLPSDY